LGHGKTISKNKKNMGEKVIQVCWIQHGGEAIWAQQIANGLRSHGIEVKFVTTIRATHEEYLKNGFESYFISQIFGSKESFSDVDFAKLDRKYGYPLIKNIVDSDVHLGFLFGRDENKKKQIVACAYKYWEEFFDEHSIDYLIVRETATFATRTAYNIARNRGKPLLMRPDIGPADSYFTMCDVGEHYYWEELLNLLGTGVRELNAEEREAVTDLIRERTKRKELPPKLRSIPHWIQAIGTLVGTYLKEKKLSLATDPVWKAGLRLTCRNLAKRTLWRYITLKTFPYDKPEDEKYVYFPMYFGNETMTLANHHFWAKNQQALIREIAASLPEGYKLYVKEHPSVPGEFSFFELRKIKNIPGVKLVRPLMSSQSLIMHSSAVVVLSGSAGWEAFLHRKPVVALGSHLYTCSRLVNNVKDITTLPHVLWTAVSGGEDIYDKHENEWLWYIYCLIASSGRGTFITYEPPYFDHMTQENTSILADAMAAKIKRRLSEEPKGKVKTEMLLNLKAELESINLD